MVSNALSRCTMRCRSSLLGVVVLLAWTANVCARETQRELQLRRRMSQLLPKEREALNSVGVGLPDTLERQPVTAPPRKQGIDEGIDCEATTWCDDKGVCADICARGSVRVSAWQQWAMRFQMAMARKQPLCFTQLLATHNSAITLADGYGNRDEVYSSYLRWLKTFGAATTIHTNNQVLSLTDQLNLGVRVVELDVHYVADELRIAHCGGLHSQLFDRIVSLVNAVAKLFGRPEMVWDAETVGCSPSLSSIAVKDQRLFADALAEVSEWMKQPNNADELVVLFFDDQPNLAEWKKLPQMLEQISQHFPSDWILTPSDAQALMLSGPSEEAPSIDDLVARGKRLVLLSGTDYGDDSGFDQLIFSNNTMLALCPYNEAWMEHFTFNGESGNATPAALGATVRQRHGLNPDMCYVEKPAHTHAHELRHELLFTGQLVRMPSCELLYGPLDCHFRAGEPNRGLKLDEEALQQVTACGLNFPAPDTLTPDRAAAHLWSWAPDNPPVDQQGSLQHGAGRHVQATGSAAPDLHEDAACAYAHAADGRWRTGPCGPSVNLETVTACRQAEGRPAASATRFQGHSIRQPVQPPFWVLVPLSDCASTSCCPAGYIFDVPHSAVENLLLKQAMEAMGVDRALLALKPPTYYPPWLSPASTPATPAS